MDTERACAFCGKPIRETDEKATIQGVPYHSHCFDKSLKAKPPQR